VLRGGLVKAVMDSRLRVNPRPSTLLWILALARMTDWKIIFILRDTQCTDYGRFSLYWPWWCRCQRDGSYAWKSKAQGRSFPWKL